MPLNLLIVPFEPWHLTAMKSRPEQMSEQMLIEQSYGTEQYGEYLRSGSISAETALIGGKIVASAGILQTQPHVGDCWAFFSEEFPSIENKNKFRIVKRIIENLESSGLPRVQATCEEGFDVAEKFLKRIGMQFEGVLRNYGVDKVNHKMYSYIGE